MSAVGRAIGTLAGSAGGGGSTAGTGLLGGPWGLLASVALMALSIGLSYLQKPPAAVGVDRGVSGKLRSGGTVARSFVMGERWGTPGKLEYANTWGVSDGTPNAVLFQVISLSDLPGAELLSLTVNGEAATYDPDANTVSVPGNPVDGYVRIPEFEADGDDHLWVKYYDGTQAAADPGLVSIFAADPDRPWESTAVGTGVAYVIVASMVGTAEGEPWAGGFPEFKWVVGNLPWYDPREDDTAGGSGPQRFDDPDTWGGDGDGNPIVQVYNILRGVTVEGVWLFGLQNLHPARVPYAAWAAAMNECDVLKPKAGGGTEPQFRTGGEIFVSEQPAAAIERLLRCCNGRLAEIGGIYKPRVGAVGAAVMSFDDGALFSTDPQDFDQFPSLAETVNAVTGRYVSEADAWELADAPGRFDADLEEEDGDRQLVANADYENCSNHRQAQRLMFAALKEARKFRKHVLPMPPEARVLEPLDVVSWTSARNGYSTKKFTVDYAEYLPSLGVIVSVTECDPADYDWSTDDELPQSDGIIKVIKPPPQPIKDFAASGTSRNGIAGILLSWDPDMPAINGVRFQVRRDSDQVVILDSQTDAWEAGSLFISHNIAHAFAYEVRAKYRPTAPRPMTYSGWLDVTTPDVAPWDPDIEAINVDLDQLDQYARGQANYLRRLAAAVASGDLQNFKAIQAVQTSLKVTYEQFLGEINILNFAVSTANETIAGQITQANARFEGTIGAQAAALQALTARVTVTEDGLEVVTQSLTELDARVTNAEGDVLGFATTIALMESKVNEVGGQVVAQGLLIQSIGARVDGATAGGMLAITATANQAGAKTRIALRARAVANEAATVREAALFIEAVDDATLGKFSRVGIVASQFYLADTAAAGVRKFPFRYEAGLLTLSADVRIKGNLIVDGTITEAGLARGATGDMDYLDQSQFTLTTANNQYTPIGRVTVETASVGAVDFILRFNIAPNTSPPSRTNARLIRVRDGKQIRLWGGLGADNGYADSMDFVADLAPLDGLTTYEFQVQSQRFNATNYAQVDIRVTSHKRGFRRRA